MDFTQTGNGGHLSAKLKGFGMKQFIVPSITLKNRQTRSTQTWIHPEYFSLKWLFFEKPFGINTQFAFGRLAGQMLSPKFSR